MRKFLAVGGVAILGLFAIDAVAEEATGTVQNIDLTRNTFELRGKTFTASPSNTVGVKLDELMEGDKVTVEFEAAEQATGPINAMVIKKPEEGHSIPSPGEDPCVEFPNLGHCP
jgi:hypothetical protein